MWRRSTAVFAAGMFAVARPVTPGPDAETVVLSDERMACIACERTVRKALGRVPGVGDVQVDRRSKTVVVRLERKVEIQELTAATAASGFRSRLATENPR